MLTLNKRQQDYLQRKLDAEVSDLDKFLSKLIEDRRKGFGNVDYSLGWNTAGVMLTDQLCREYQRLLEIAASPDAKATLETLTAHYRRAQTSWSPQHSSNPVSNLQHEQALETIKRVLDTLERLAELGEEKT